MPNTLSQQFLSTVVDRLGKANAGFDSMYQGSSNERQPVHTLYGGAHLFKVDTPQKLGALALAAMKEHAADFIQFAQALGLQGSEELPTMKKQAEALRKQMERDGGESRRTNPTAWLAHTVYQRVTEKLQREPVEDFRIDFEDGYGTRSDAEEDRHAEFTAREAALASRNRTLPPFTGIRIKPLTERTKLRSIRTLDLFVSELARRAGGDFPKRFVVTLPKVTIPEQVEALAELLGELESELRLPPQALKMEIMVETPQALLDYRGASALPLLLEASDRRCVSMHFGPYDFTAGVNISSAYQALDHPAADVARLLMNIAVAGTGITLSDGPVNIVPVPIHESADGKSPLTTKQKEENRQAIHRAWQISFQSINRALRQGLYQGWDLHPSQLPVRYAAMYAFFLGNLDSAAARLRNFVEQSARAVMTKEVFDDEATGKGLLNFFLRGIACGAFGEKEIAETGLTIDQIHMKSFTAIMESLKPPPVSIPEKQPERAERKQGRRRHFHHSRGPRQKSGNRIKPSKP